ncbi:hypothetical protein DVDV_0252 [Desulfovibrio sp. DV]|nr:hypothetical protein DVDV_0252 [Desulfovibrio sp. DV]
MDKAVWRTVHGVLRVSVYQQARVLQPVRQLFLPGCHQLPSGA